MAKICKECGRTFPTRLCRLCRKWKSPDESVGLPHLKGGKGADLRWFCLKCWENRRPEIVELVTREVVEKFIQDQKGADEKKGR